MRLKTIERTAEDTAGNLKQNWFNFNLWDFYLFYRLTRPNSIFYSISSVCPLAVSVLGFLPFSTFLSSLLSLFKYKVSFNSFFIVFCTLLPLLCFFALLNVCDCLWLLVCYSLFTSKTTFLATLLSDQLEAVFFLLQTCLSYCFLIAPGATEATTAMDITHHTSHTQLSQTLTFTVILNFSSFSSSNIIYSR